MVRLFLGLLAASVLLYGGLHFLGKRAHSVGERPAAQIVDPLPSSMARGRAVVDDYKRAEADNRAVVDRTLKAAGEANQTGAN